MQEALLAATTQWPAEGLPTNPRGWLIQVGYRRMIELVRGEQARRRRRTWSPARIRTTDGTRPRRTRS
ncbi:hypothetical protein NKG94_23095 [Micromonospora sp. M12]